MSFRKCTVFAVGLSLVCSVRASWYWPFSSASDEGEKREPRLSQVMEPATRLIDEATDLASEGKVSESVERYREALAILDKVEAENPERAQKPEFATLRHKRAYVNATIDALLLKQVRDNAKAVAVSDTAELERRLAAERAAKRGDPAPAKAAPGADGAAPRKGETPRADGAAPRKGETAEGDGAAPEAKGTAAESKEAAAGDEGGASVLARLDSERPGVAPQASPSRPIPLDRRQQALKDIAAGDLAAADILISEMLEERPDSAMALNLKAMKECREGRLEAAERTLVRAISSHPRSHHAYYNMARLTLQRNPGAKDAARRYYRAGRSLGGPASAKLEDLLK